jgi:hypothetical protein
MCVVHQSLGLNGLSYQDIAHLIPAPAGRYA